MKIRLVDIEENGNTRTYVEWLRSSANEIEYALLMPEAIYELFSTSIVEESGIVGALEVFRVYNTIYTRADDSNGELKKELYTKMLEKLKRGAGHE